jgi:hypothetical protein
VFDSGHGLSTEEQEYNPTPIINEIRRYVEDWRNLPNPDRWQVTLETTRLLQHWRHNQFQERRVVVFFGPEFGTVAAQISSPLPVRQRTLN